MPGQMPASFHIGRYRQFVACPAEGFRPMRMDITSETIAFIRPGTPSREIATPFKNGSKSTSWTRTILKSFARCSPNRFRRKRDDSICIHDKRNHDHRSGATPQKWRGVFCWHRTAVHCRESRAADPRAGYCFDLRIGPHRSETFDTSALDRRWEPRRDSRYGGLDTGNFPLLVARRPSRRWISRCRANRPLCKYQYHRDRELQETWHAAARRRRCAGNCELRGPSGSGAEAVGARVREKTRFCNFGRPP